MAQQVASIGKVQKTVLLLALRVLAARVRHVPPPRHLHCPSVGSTGLRRGQGTQRGGSWTVDASGVKGKAGTVGRASRDSAL